VRYVTSIGCPMQTPGPPPSRSVRVTVRLPRSLLGRIDDARQGGEDRSAVLRRLLEAALAGQCQPVSDGIIPAV